ncbi:MbtH family protein [Micromonospora sp. R77]|uniref:MbtH family protein n=1 Tax=Micromonospora sp. R77 TaxID=2925836 RepID=UPI0024159DC8|nr:MbtH family protein [Micromonospora sp. R77]
MTNPFDVPDAVFSVLVNEQGQHSLWPYPIDVPTGWTTVHGPTDRAACDAYVRSHRVDPRPGGPRRDRAHPA